MKTPEEFAKDLADELILLPEDERDIAKAVKARDAEVRRAAIEEAAKGIEAAADALEFARRGMFGPGQGFLCCQMYAEAPPPRAGASAAWRSRDHDIECMSNRMLRAEQSARSAIRALAGKGGER